MEINEITGVIVDSAYKVHQSLGPGLLENTYKQCLKAELRERGLFVAAEVTFPIKYRNTVIELAYRADLLVEDAVIVELKAVDSLSGIHRAQLYTYLKLSSRRIGLLINFNTQLIKNGIVRVCCSDTSEHLML